MERKYGKVKDSADSWMYNGGSSPGRMDHRQQLLQTRFLLKRVSVIALCLVVSVSGVASFRLLTTGGPTSVEGGSSGGRELLEERDMSQPFRLGPQITDWDEQRSAWLEKNPHMRTNLKGKPRIFMVTGSPAAECANPLGDFWLLKAFKNKMDYCRMHDIESYYNMGVMDRAMVDFWIKLPLIRNSMLAHPEAEWIWWMDSDAMFTDMTFEIPLEKYGGHNMIVHGWDTEIFQRKNWVGLNAGIFLLRNCQWTLDFLDLWGSLGEDRGTHRWKMGKVFTSTLKGRISNFPADDQSALIYLLNTMEAKLRPKIFIESSYYLHGFWVELTEKFRESETTELEGGNWPFITHFVGCKLCGHNNDYPTKTCLKQMNRAFNFADNQVLKAFGYRHDSLESPSLHQIATNSSHQLS